MYSLAGLSTLFKNTLPSVLDTPLIVSKKSMLRKQSKLVDKISNLFNNFKPQHH